MSGSDPTGYNWFSDLVSTNSSGWESSTFFGGALAIVGGAYITSLAQAGAFAQGGSLEGFSGSSGAGGAIAVAEAIQGLNDPGANASYAAPTGELGSGATLYNEGAGTAPPTRGDAVACMPGCLPDPRAAFATEEQYQAWLDGVWISSNTILAAEGLVSVGGSVGRWLLGRAAARTASEALKLGRFRMTETVAKHASDIIKKGPFKGQLARPYLNSPHTVEEILRAGKGVTDPGGVAGALRWDVPGTFRGSKGTWELVLKGDTILHFNFVTP